MRGSCMPLGVFEITNFVFSTEPNEEIKNIDISSSIIIANVFLDPLFSDNNLWIVDRKKYMVEASYPTLHTYIYFNEIRDGKSAIEQENL